MADLGNDSGLFNDVTKHEESKDEPKPSFA